MTRSLKHRHMEIARREKRDRALKRPELNETNRPAVLRPSLGATSPMIRDVDPETRALIDAAVAQRRQGMSVDALRKLTMEPNVLTRARLYEQVQDFLRESIRGGKWKVGEQLPPESKLADEFKCSPGTIRKALDTLEFEGVLSRQQGKGTFVASARPAKCPHCGAPIKPSINRERRS